MATNNYNYEEDPSEKEELPKNIKERIEKNRNKAVAIKKSKLVSHPYSKREVVSIDKSTIKIGSSKYKDTGGGFLLEEKEDEPQQEYPLVQTEAPIAKPDRPECEYCEKLFASSYCFDKFDFPCCDDCKDTHDLQMITKTDAKTKYLLKDCDFDKREPPLKFIEKPNPHNHRWGKMKLYLEAQVKRRALQIWKGQDNLDKEKECREEKRVMTKAKRYDKQLKELRMGVRSSLYDHTTQSHTHEFEVEYNPEEDLAVQRCKTCSFSVPFEVM